MMQDYRMNLPVSLLSDSEMMELLQKAQGDIDARERLVNCNLKLIFNLIQRLLRS